MDQATRNAIKQAAYRQRVAARAEPAVHDIEVAIAATVAAFAESAAKGPSAGNKQLVNRLLTDVTVNLEKAGFDKVKATEALSRRIAFLIKELAEPHASATVRKSWLRPLPSNRPQHQENWHSYDDGEDSPF